MTRLPEAVETQFFPSISKGSDPFVLIIGLPLKIHLKKSMTLALRRKAGLGKQMLQTIKYCQNARPHKSALGYFLAIASGFSLIHWIYLVMGNLIRYKSDRVFYCNTTLIYWMDIVWTGMA